jgi:hypothetical protein
VTSSSSRIGTWRSNSGRGEIACKASRRSFTRAFALSILLTKIMWGI